jgi:hypothetical protein
MTQKHIMLLGDFIRTHNVKVAHDCPSLTPFRFEHFMTLCSFMESVNPRFNRQKWLEYVGAIGLHKSEITARNPETWEKIES